MESQKSPNYPHATSKLNLSSIVNTIQLVLFVGIFFGGFLKLVFLNKVGLGQYWSEFLGSQSTLYAIAVVAVSAGALLLSLLWFVPEAIFKAFMHREAFYFKQTFSPAKQKWGIGVIVLFTLVISFAPVLYGFSYGWPQLLALFLLSLIILLVYWVSICIRLKKPNLSLYKYRLRTTLSHVFKVWFFLLLLMALLFMPIFAIALITLQFVETDSALILFLVFSSIAYSLVCAFVVVSQELKFGLLLLLFIATLMTVILTRIPLNIAKTLSFGQQYVDLNISNNYNTEKLKKLMKQKHVVDTDGKFLLKNIWLVAKGDKFYAISYSHEVCNTIYLIPTSSVINVDIISGEFTSLGNLKTAEECGGLKMSNPTNASEADYSL
jgi:hypothetical protein